MKTPTKDLFDDSTMTFGEHLEVLRVHLLRAIIGLVLAACVCLLFGDRIIHVIRQPIDRAMIESGRPALKNDLGDYTQSRKNFVAKALGWIGLGSAAETISGPTPEELAADQQHIEHPELVTVSVDPRDLLQALHQADPERFPEPAPPAPVETPAGEAAEAPAPPPLIRLPIRATDFAEFRSAVTQTRQVVTLKVEEAFMTYMKVSLIAAAVLASPWIFYQIWLFVAAGLYPHERKYVHVFGTISLGLFLVGAFFCFYGVFPFVLRFLIDYNKYLGSTLQPRLSDYISLAVMLPVMFGIAFQLPLVMLFLERINIVSASIYRQQRRMAILIIAILSAVLTPAEPVSMLMMMFPLIFLYELGILLCQWLPSGRSLQTA